MGAMACCTGIKKRDKRVQNVNLEKLLSQQIMVEWKEHYISYNMLTKEISSSKDRLFHSEDVSEEEQLPNSKSCACFGSCCKKKEYAETKSTEDIDQIHVEKRDAVNISSTEQPLIDDEDLEEKYNNKSEIINHFQSILDAESRKVNIFYLSIQQHAYSEYKLVAKRLRSLSLQNDIELESLSESDSDLANYTNTSIDTKKSTSKQSEDIYLHKTKKDIFLLYQRLVGIVNFATLNRLAFETIVKKFNKELQCDTDDMLQIPQAEFVQNTKCNQYIDDLVKIYADIYESGDIDRGKIHLFHTISRKNARNQWKNRFAAFLMHKNPMIFMFLVQKNECIQQR